MISYIHVTGKQTMLHQNLENGLWTDHDLLHTCDWETDHALSKPGEWTKDGPWPLTKLEDGCDVFKKFFLTN